VRFRRRGKQRVADGDVFVDGDIENRKRAGCDRASVWILPARPSSWLPLM
jgi:hypothetical protein